MDRWWSQTALWLSSLPHRALQRTLGNKNTLSIFSTLTPQTQDAFNVTRFKHWFTPATSVGTNSRQCLTIDVAAVLPEELQSVRMVVFHWLWHVDDVCVSIVIPVKRWGQTRSLTSCWTLTGWRFFFAWCWFQRMYQYSCQKPLEILQPLLLDRFHASSENNTTCEAWRRLFLFYLRLSVFVLS